MRGVWPLCHLVYAVVMTDLDVTDAARALGVSERTVRRWLRDGRLTGYRVGRRIRIPEHAVREAVAPYTDARPESPDEIESDPILRFLRDPARRRARREAAARAMDRFAETLAPAQGPEDTAEGIIRAIRDEEDANWDHFLDPDRP